MSFFRDLMSRPKYLVSFSHIYQVEVKIFKFEDEKIIIIIIIAVYLRKNGRRYLPKVTGQ